MVARFSVAFALVASFGVEAVVAQPALPLSTVAPKSASPSSSASGLHLSFEGLDEDGNVVTDSRVARAVALYVPTTTSPSPRIARSDDPVVARWRGQITLAQRDRYTFRFVGTGRFALRIDGELVLEAEGAGTPVTSDAVRLNKGGHALEATYTSVAGEPASARLEWASRRFALEPMPPRVFSHDPSDEALQQGIALRTARSLIATRRCVACHAAPDFGDEDSMPELAMRGPALTAVADRLEPNWLRAWLRAPTDLRSSARMPHLLQGEPAEVEQQAADLTAWLGTIHGESALVGSNRGGRAESDSADDVELGGYLFADLGCIACHRVGDEPAAGADRIDLRGVGRKFRPGALAQFVEDPARHDPWTRMPEFGLSTEEAGRLAAFLRTLRSPDGALPKGEVAGDAARGAELARALQCAACHSIPGLAPTAAMVGSLEDVLSGSTKDGGCLAVDADGRGRAPAFRFTDDERRALRVFATAGVGTLRRASPAEFAMRAIEERRCTACHALDGRADDWSLRESLLAAVLGGAEDGGDELEPAVSQARPELTWVGDKLRPDWMHDLFAGRVEEPTRPWLRARMPRFRGIAADLASGLAAMHGHAPTMPAEPEPEDRLVEIGETLVSATGGFACVTCHAIGDQPPLAVFEVQGTNFATTAGRLREDFFHRWMWNPLRVDPASRMPRYSDDEGKTPFTNYLGGDARAQYGAIWSYFRRIR